MIKDAILSDCEMYRYVLIRKWGDGPSLNFIMVNPSTADANLDDATIRKCIGFAKMLGYKSIIVTNLYALRSKDVKDLKCKANGALHIHAENKKHVQEQMVKADAVIVAWGSRDKMPKTSRDKVIRHVSIMANDNDVVLYRLGGVTKSNDPRHPLMLAYNTELEKHHG